MSGKVPAGLMWHPAGGQILISSAHITVTGIISGEFHSANWKNEAIAEE